MYKDKVTEKLNKMTMTTYIYQGQIAVINMISQDLIYTDLNIISIS